MPAVPLAAISHAELRSLVLVLAASAVAAFLSRIGPRLVLPTVVVEIVLGILLGPQVFGWADAGDYIEFLSNFGLALLFFFAGIEVLAEHVPKRAIVRGTIGWTISLALGIAVGYILHGQGLDAAGWLVGIALSTTALGTLVPILSDSGAIATPLGTAVLGTGVAALALRARPPRLVRIMRETLHSTGQTAVRLAMALLGALVLLASDVGFDFVLGAFAAGLIVGLVLDSPEGRVVRMRLEGIGFGFLIPIYFVTTGITFDLDSLLTAHGFAIAILFLGLLLLVRGASALLWLRELGARQAAALAVFGATALPLIVASVTIGTERGAISAQVGASLIGAGMLSVLAYPLLADALARTGQWPAGPPAEDESEF